MIRPTSWMLASTLASCLILVGAGGAGSAHALEIKRMTLTNGATLLVSENHQLPMVTVEIALDAGSRHDPQGKAGLAMLTARCVNQGTRELSATAFAEKVAFMGSSLFVSADELQKAKNLEAAQVVFGQDSVFRQAMLLGIYELLGDYRLVDAYLPGIDKVTAADVQRVASRYLVSANRTTGVLIPTGVLPKGAMGGGPGGGQVRHTDLTANEVAR